jgi:hypothetical protein
MVAAPAAVNAHYDDPSICKGQTDIQSGLMVVTVAAAILSLIPPFPLCGGYNPALSRGRVFSGSLSRQLAEFRMAKKGNYVCKGGGYWTWSCRSSGSIAGITHCRIGK